MSINGIVVPVVTPLTKQYTLDRACFVRLLRKLVAARVGGIFVAGTSGLGPVLTTKILDKTLRLARETVGDAVPLLGGAMEASTPRTIERIRLLRNWGYQYFVCAAPYYIKAADNESLFAHFAACAKAFPDMKMCIYNIPFCVGGAIPLAVVSRMARELPLCLAKDSGGDAAYFTALCRIGNEFDFPVFQGLRPDFRTLIREKAAGCVPVIGNIFPDMLVKLWLRASKGDFDDNGQQFVNRAWEALVKPNDFLSGTLFAMSLLGEGTGTTLPVIPVPDAVRKKIIADLINSIKGK